MAGKQAKTAQALSIVGMVTGLLALAFAGMVWKRK
jgi:hypothetical protein